MKRAFTLVETTIAITILVTALVGILALASYSYSVGGQTSETILSTSLAREGMEVVRAIRESNWLALNTWNNGLSAGNFIANADSTILTSADNPVIRDCTNCRLCLSGGRYLHFCGTGTTPTIYKRMLTIENIPPDIRISSEVLWRTKSGERTINLQQILTNWR